MGEQILIASILLLSLALTAQAAFTLMLMLYTWAHPERLAKAASPDTYAPPRLSFTAILPARHEQDVIAHTIHRVWETRYPKDLLEVVVVCEQGDTETISEAQRAIDEIGHRNLRVITFSGQPINKPRGLNVAFRETRNDVVTIFDAEDDVHPEMFWIVNTIMSDDDASIVQAGVQLMDFQSRWFSVHNVLEYFFWFKSRLHFHARVGMVPLGGNTVFVRRPLIDEVGGWDEHCLTEDADIGLRLSALHKRIAVTYDARHTTREETPPTLDSFVRQRTRWNQGFMQILQKGTWRDLPTRGQRVLAVYTLAFPFIQAFVGALWLPALFAMLFLQMPVVVAMLSLLPLYALGFQYLTNLVGLYEFASTYGVRVRPRDLVVFTLGFLPYQLLLSIGAVRAVYREVRGVTNWEKTAHTGAHRGTVDSIPAQLERLLDEAAEHLGIERGSILVPNANGSFALRASRGLQAVETGNSRFMHGEDVARQAATRREAVIDNLQDVLSQRSHGTQFEPGSSIVLPVERNNRVVAVVSVSSRETQLESTHVAWLRTRAGQLLASGHQQPTQTAPTLVQHALRGGS